MCKQAILLYDKLEEIWPLQSKEFQQRQHLRAMIFELANIEEKLWVQGACFKWLKQGDSNIRYFHIHASYRARNNVVTYINSAGQISTNQKEIQQAFYNQIRAQLGSTAATTTFNPFRLYSTKHDLSGLGEQFTQEEIHAAVMGLASNRASGPDGMTNKFLKTYWHEVKDEIMIIMDQFFQGNLDLHPFNRANVIILSKKEETITMQDYRLISIINLIPKVVAKVLANRLSTKLPELILVEQMSCD